MPSFTLKLLINVISGTYSALERSAGPLPAILALPLDPWSAAIPAVIAAAANVKTYSTVPLTQPLGLESGP